MTCDALRVVTIRNERYRVPCGSRYCPACGARWSKDQRVRAVAAAKDLTGDCAILTITGPGDDVFNPKGSRGPLRKKARMRAWNATARERWRDFHREASREPRRTARENGCDWRLLYRTWEWQSRGVLHLHLVVPYGTQEERDATDDYLCELWMLAREHGFGYVLGGDRDEDPSWDRPPTVKPASANAVAAYVSKYVTKAGSADQGMVSVARAAGMRGSVVYVANHLLQRSGVSMTTLRARRRIVGRYPFARTGRRGWQEACAVDAVQRGRAPLTGEAVQTIRALTGRGVPFIVGEAGRWDVVRPTRAPEPLGLRGYPPVPFSEEGRVVIGLASVLLRVPDGEDLGWFRTDVVQVGSL